uniref:Putative ovule protein n=1 Tax=Solanum chacoense TaxID=4108 RepID=A0A0V0HCX3_SOLCH
MLHIANFNIQIPFNYFSLFCSSTFVVTLLNSFLIVISYFFNMSIGVVAISPSIFLLFLNIFIHSSTKFCNHNFTVPISVLSI